MMADAQFLIIRLLGIISGATITTLNIVVCSLLNGQSREEMKSYVKSLRDDFATIIDEMNNEEVSDR